MTLTLPPQVNKALSMLTSAGFEAYAVGGCVRDLVMGKEPNDFDITTSALPNETEDVFKNYKIIETGIKHGTVTVIINSMPLEITTYRIDGDYADNRHPKCVSFSRSLKDDLARRDFTVNTLCYNEKDGLVDMFGGLEDIKKGLIKAVGDPDRRFNEDALRIIRAIRFACVLGFEIDEATSDSLIRNRALLDKIAIERIREEFIKLILGKNVLEIMMKYHCVIEQFIPEFTPLIGCAQNTPYHLYDVFEHSMRALDAVEKDKVLRLTMFFHDFGKPAAKFTDFNGTDHFKGHAPLGGKITHSVLRSMKFDNKTIAQVSRLVELHAFKTPRDKAGAKRLLRRCGQENYLYLISIKRADNLAKAQPHLVDEKLKNMMLFYNQIIDGNECYSLEQLAVNGNDIIKLGYSDGNEIHRILEWLLFAVINENCPNSKKNLSDYLEANYDNKKS